MSSMAHAGDTIFTTMLILQEGGRSTHPPAEYLRHFAKLAQTELPIVFYLDPALVDLVDAPNVTVIPTALQDLAVWQSTRGQHLELPAARHPKKDTADYLILVNAKTELIQRTIARSPTAARHAWVDAGLFHVISDEVRARRRLRRLAPPDADLVVIPGCWERGDAWLDRINWRFCGGLFYGSRTAMARFAELHQQAFRELLPAISWEVNLWAWLEAHRGFTCTWRHADHNDLLLGPPE